MDVVIKSLQIGKLSCECFALGSGRTCYLLMPMPPDGRNVAALAKKYGCSIAVLHGMDWDNDLTPWAAPGVYRGDADFRGEAAQFLDFLRRDVFPDVEAVPGMAATLGRDLVGVSLSGLFAMWAWMQGDDFGSLGCLSASFWYDGFVNWLVSGGIRPKSGTAYISLGDLEGRDGDSPRFRSVQKDTAQVVDALRLGGIRTVFEQTSGTHYAPFYPRLEKALSALYASK